MDNNSNNNDEDLTPMGVFFTISDKVFLALYTTEMVLKILGMGFMWKKGSYLRDYWNILDFVIIVSGYITYITDAFKKDSNNNSGLNLSVLRTFRVLRPLRTISSIEGLRMLVQALVLALPLLLDTILVLIFFFVIFGIAGL